MPNWILALKFSGATCPKHIPLIRHLRTHWNPLEMYCSERWEKLKRWTEIIGFNGCWSLSPNWGRGRELRVLLCNHSLLSLMATPMQCKDVFRGQILSCLFHFRVIWYRHLHFPASTCVDYFGQTCWISSHCNMITVKRISVWGRYFVQIMSHQVICIRHFTWPEAE